MKLVMWVSATFLVLAVLLLVFHRSALGRVVAAQYRVAPRVVAGLWALFGATGLTFVASERWYRGNAVFSYGSLVLLIGSIAAMATVVVIGSKRRYTEQVKRDGPSAAIHDLLR